MEGDEIRPRGELKSSEILFGDVPIVSLCHEAIWVFVVQLFLLT